MNEATFIWNEIYEEFATKLLEYKMIGKILFLNFKMFMKK